MSETEESPPNSELECVKSPDIIDQCSTAELTLTETEKTCKLEILERRLQIEESEVQICETAHAFQNIRLRLSEQMKLEETNLTLQRVAAVLRTYKERLFDQLSEIETVNRNTVWKISSFLQKMKQSAICSQPFFVERLHYKAYLQLHPNGKGVGEGNQVSLFFVLIKGEFDEHLQWPFTCKVTFKLINQTGGRDIIHTFQPDPIKKPGTDDEFACGSPCFVSHMDLKNGSFVKDDTLFIQCEIHPVN